MIRHLLTFMKVGQPSLFFRAMVLGAQGVFFNAFFLSYLISPRICHRFVGKLEEEAVYTYSMAIQEVEEGRLPEWTDKPAPRIAIDYWRLPEDAKMLDVLYAVRSDEAGHRVRRTFPLLQYDGARLTLVFMSAVCKPLFRQLRREGLQPFRNQEAFWSGAGQCSRLYQGARPGVVRQGTAGFAGGRTEAAVDARVGREAA